MKKERDLSDISGETLTMADHTPLPTIRVISKSPSRDNDSLDVDLEKLDFADFTPDATSTLPRRSKSALDALDSYNKDNKDKNSKKDTKWKEISLDSDKDLTQLDADLALTRAYSSFGIAPIYTGTKEAAPTVKDSRYPF